METKGETERDRRHLTVKDFVGVAVLLMNFGGLVWGAATLSGSVAQLRDSVNDLRTVAKDLSTQMSSVKEDYGSRIRILELMVGDLKGRTR